MGADLHRAQREQHLGLSRWVFRCLQILAECILSFGQVFQLCGRVSKIKQEISFNAARIIDFAKCAQVFFGGLEVFLVVISNSEPLQNFRRHICIRAVRHEIVHLFRKLSPILQIKLT